MPDIMQDICWKNAVWKQSVWWTIVMILFPILTKTWGQRLTALESYMKLIMGHCENHISSSVITPRICFQFSSIVSDQLNRLLAQQLMNFIIENNVFFSQNGKLMLLFGPLLLCLHVWEIKSLLASLFCSLSQFIYSLLRLWAHLRTTIICKERNTWNHLALRMSLQTVVTE